MPLVTTTEMFKKAYEGGYAIGAFNVNNMEIVQGIVDAAKEEQSPLIFKYLQALVNMQNIFTLLNLWKQLLKTAICQSRFTLTTAIPSKFVKTV